MTTCASICTVCVCSVCVSGDQLEIKIKPNTFQIGGYDMNMHYKYTTVNVYVIVKRSTNM